MNPVYPCCLILFNIQESTTININHEEKRETALDFSLTGAKCVALVDSLYMDIVKGNMAAASETVGELTKYAVELIEQSEQMVSKMNKVFEEHKQKTEEIQRNIASLHEQENALRLTLSHKEASLKIAQDELSRAQAALSDANTKLQQAHDEVARAREKSAVTQRFTTAAGIIFGTVIPISILGPLLGGYTGNRIGAVISEDDVRIAERAVEQCKQKVKRHQADHNTFKFDISQIEKDISVIQEQIKRQEEERLKTNESAKQIKGAAVLFQKAFIFWKTFSRHRSEHGGNHAELFHGIIIEKAKEKEKENLDILKCDGCKKVAMSFVEAWEVMVTNFMKGYEFISAPSPPPPPPHTHTHTTLSHDEMQLAINSYD